MDGFVFLVGVEPGREFKKNDIAALLGYRGQNPWKDNQTRIWSLLGPFYEQDPGNVQVLRRKAIPGLLEEASDRPQKDEPGSENDQAVQ